MTPVFAAHLQDQTLVQVEGPDAGKFLQGQVTCDVQSLEVSQSSLGACCDNKGRMCAIFQVLRSGDTAYLLRMSRPVALALVSHLSKFKVFFKCSLQILEHSRVWGLWSNSDMPLATDNLVQADSTLACHFSHAPDQVELWQPHPSFSSQQWLDANQSILSEKSENLWKERQFKQGIPELTSETLAEFIPQALNLEALQAISFTKGCYTGQEIVARTHYLGKLKKSMHLYRGSPQAAKTIATPGQSLYSDAGEFGQIVNILATADDLWVLVVADNEAVRKNTPVFADSERMYPLAYIALSYTSTTK